MANRYRDSNGTCRKEVELGLYPGRKDSRNVEIRR